MPNRCCVEKCKTNCPSQIKKEGLNSVLKFPNDLKRKEQWLRNIPGKLKKSEFICIKHFEKQFIKEYSIEGCAASKLKNFKLTNDAYPTIFDIVSPHLQKRVKNKRKKIIKKIPSLSPCSIPSPRSSPIPCFEIKNDLINNLNDLIQNINKINLCGFEVKFTDDCGFFYKLNLKKNLKIDACVTVENNLELSMYFDGVKQKEDTIIGVNNRLVFLSQLNDLLLKYSNKPSFSADAPNELL